MPLAWVAMAYQGVVTPRNRAAIGSSGACRSWVSSWPLSSRNTPITRPGSSRPTGPLASVAMPANRAMATWPSRRSASRSGWA